MTRIHRSLEHESRRAEAYWNVRRRFFSVRKDGLVVGRVEALLLFDAVFKVSAAGRERVRRTGRKNVHAVVRGHRARPATLRAFVQELEGGPDAARDVHRWYRAGYDPMRDEGFVLRPAHFAAGVLLGADEVLLRAVDGRPEVWVREPIQVAPAFGR